jgi:hypothetical protein
MTNLSSGAETCRIFAVTAEEMGSTTLRSLRLLFQRKNAATSQEDDFLLTQPGTGNMRLETTRQGHFDLFSAVVCRETTIYDDVAGWQVVENSILRTSMPQYSLRVFINLDSARRFRSISYFMPLVDMFQQVVIVTRASDPFLAHIFDSAAIRRQDFNVTTVFVAGKFSSLSVPQASALGKPNPFVTILGGTREELLSIGTQLAKKVDHHDAFIRTVFMVRPFSGKPELISRLHVNWSPSVHIRRVAAISVLFVRKISEPWDSLFSVDGNINAEPQPEPRELVEDSDPGYQLFVLNVDAELVDTVLERLSAKNPEMRFGVCPLGQICEEARYSASFIQSKMHFGIRLFADPSIIALDNSDYRLPRAPGRLYHSSAAYFPLPAPDSRRAWIDFVTAKFCRPLCRQENQHMQRQYIKKIRSFVVTLSPLGLPPYILLWLFEYVCPEACYFGELARIRAIEETAKNCSAVVRNRVARETIRKIES